MPASWNTAGCSNARRQGSAWFSQTLITRSSHSGINPGRTTIQFPVDSVDNLILALVGNTRTTMLFDKTNSGRDFSSKGFSASRLDRLGVRPACWFRCTFETPWGSASQNAVFARPTTYGTMLPENDHDRRGKRLRFRLPQLQAIFTPKYREQGSFSGTALLRHKAEVANGATPACRINFVCRWKRTRSSEPDENRQHCSFSSRATWSDALRFVFSRSIDF